MSAHLSSTLLNGLADGELSAEQLAVAQEHLASCPACTSSALVQSLLKSATANSGRRYAPKADFACATHFPNRDVDPLPLERCVASL